MSLDWIPKKDAPWNEIERWRLDVKKYIGGAGASGSLDTTNFDNNLSAADDTIQKALETLDDLKMVGMNAGNWKLFYSDGSGDVTELALGASGTYLKANGASSAPTWAAVTPGYWTKSGSDIYYTAGRVSIGASSSSYPLYVYDASGVVAVATFYNNNTGAGKAAIYAYTASTTGQNLWSVNNNASAAGAMWEGRFKRAANSAYRFVSLESGDGSDTEFILRGDGIGYSDGGWTTPASDFAEYIESESTDLPIGNTVIIDGQFIRQAVDGEIPDGVIRPKEGNATCFVGGASVDKWIGKYVRDPYGSYVQEDYDLAEFEALGRKYWFLMEDVKPGTKITKDIKIITQQRRKLNPDFIPDQTFVGRDKRNEWYVVGLLGQIPINEGQPVDPRWKKMKSITDTVSLWFVK